MKIKYLIVFFIILFIFSCGEDSEKYSDNASCENPIEFSNEKDVEGLYYIVSISDDFDVNVVAEDFDERYEDLEIRSVLSHSFSASSSEETLENIQCENEVVGLEWDNPVPVQ